MNCFVLKLQNSFYYQEGYYFVSKKVAYNLVNFCIAKVALFELRSKVLRVNAMQSILTEIPEVLILSKIGIIQGTVKSENLYRRVYLHIHCVQYRSVKTVQAVLLTSKEYMVRKLFDV